jgi:2-keto-4-pentenoate hydratase/2-oxohepta-3-ene-1,7-dioic acid hydratase in catechol pathway
MEATEQTTETAQERQQTPAYVIDDPAKAINVLVNAAEHAQRLGAYSMQEAKIIYDAIVFFRPDRSVEAVNAAAAQEEQQQQA